MDSSDNGNRQLMRYAGLAMQFLVSIALGVFIGFKADGWLKLSFPVFVWLLPLLIICGLLYQVIKETSDRK